ncbi:MAG: hypothetical protein ACRCVV_02895 [Shewanella sp.]
MYHQYLNEPVVFELSHNTLVTLTLSEDISDFVVLQAMGGPLLELIVTQEGPQPKIALRFQPLIGLTLDIQPLAPMALNGRHYAQSILRQQGQGLRLYSRMGIAPKFCAAQLRAGVAFKIAAEQGLSLALASASAAKFELVSLEHDLRILHEPQVILLAKELLARQYDYEASSESLAVYMAEIEQVRTDLRALLQGELGESHGRLAEEALRLEPLLLQKRQWLFRSYTNMFERPNYSRAANDAQHIDNALRKLECYELLASPELTQMVHRLMEDDS